jgi:hypothetical protein
MLQLPSPPFAASAVDLPLSPFFASARPAVTSMAPSFKYMLCPPTSPLFYLTSILWLRCAPPLHMMHLAHTQTACTLDDPAFLLLASAGSFFYLFFELPKEKPPKERQQHKRQQQHKVLSRQGSAIAAVTNGNSWTFDVSICKRQ